MKRGKGAAKTQALEDSEWEGEGVGRNQKWGQKKKETAQTDRSGGSHGLGVLSIVSLFFTNITHSHSCTFYRVLIHIRALDALPLGSVIGRFASVGGCGGGATVILGVHGSVGINH